MTGLVPEESGRVSYPAGPDKVVRVFVTKTISKDSQFRHLDVSFYHALISYAVLENKGRHAFYPEAKYIASIAKTWRTGGGAHEDIGRAFKQIQRFPYHSAAKQCFTDDGPSDALCRKLGVTPSELAGLAEEIFMWVGDNV